MARGGYRPGAGRKAGSLGKKHKLPESEDKQRIKEMLSMQTKAKAKAYNDLLVKIKGGNAITLAEKKVMDALAVDLAAEAGEVKQTSGEKLEPLEYMLNVMNDEQAEKDRRDKMAIAAAPFIHARKGEGAGKKQEKDEKAKAASTGKFSAGRAPIQLVK
jgi:phage terminase small subunit